MRLPVNIMIGVLAVLLPCGSASQADDGNERQQLIEQRSQLQEKVRRLDQEQERLLFRKRMYAADSKYLMLDLSRRAGELWYRNRLLMRFRIRTFERAGKDRGNAGIIAVTDRSPWGKGPRTLIFSDRLVLTAGKRSRAGGTPRSADHATLSGRDMTSLFYALDRGSLAYVLP